MPEVKFDISDADRLLVERIVDRAIGLIAKHNHKSTSASELRDLMMDLTAAHANGCPMDFARLVEADDVNIAHDVFGISRHLDRSTGQLTDFFLPRFHLRGQQLSDSDPAIMHKSLTKKLGRSHG